MTRILSKIVCLPWKDLTDHPYSSFPLGRKRRKLPSSLVPCSVLSNPIQCHKESLKTKHLKKLSVVTYHLASWVHPLQGNNPHHGHSPTDDRNNEYPCLADELIALAKAEKCVYIQKTLVVRNVYTRSVWWWQILQTLDVGFVKRVDAYGSPELSNEVMELPPVTIK